MREHSKRGAAAIFLNIYFQSTLVKNITIILKKGVKEFFLNEKKRENNSNLTTHKAVPEKLQINFTQPKIGSPKHIVPLI